jgi:cob(I)alamin adenosyltransferase
MSIDPKAYSRWVEKRAEGYAKKQAKATREKGLLIVYTGTGKGKSTAAFGMALRAIAHGMRLGVVQFIKGVSDSAEQQVLSGFEKVDFKVLGEGFTWRTQDRERAIAAAQRAWAEAERMLNDPSYAMVILDELNLVLHYGLLDLEPVLTTLTQRPEMLHVIVTGRHAPPALLAKADLVSDVRAIKHPYRAQGVKAQPGIEY